VRGRRLTPTGATAYDRCVTVAATIDERPPAEPDPTPDEAKSRPRIPDSIRRRLTPMPAWDLGSWAAAGLIMSIAAILRFAKLGFPSEKIFDELYYATEGREMLQYWVEWRPRSASGCSATTPSAGVSCWPWPVSSPC
jgi:hypothetical protein